MALNEFLVDSEDTDYDYLYEVSDEETELELGDKIMEKAAARKEAAEAEQRAAKIEDQLRDIEAKGLSDFETECRRAQLIEYRANARKEMKAAVRRAGELNDRAECRMPAMASDIQHHQRVNSRLMWAMP